MQERQPDHNFLSLAWTDYIIKIEINLKNIKMNTTEYKTIFCKESETSYGYDYKYSLNISDEDSIINSFMQECNSINNLYQKYNQNVT